MFYEAPDILIIPKKIGGYIMYKCIVCGEEAVDHTDGWGYPSARAGYFEVVNVHHRCRDKCVWQGRAFVRIKDCVGQTTAPID